MLWRCREEALLLEPEAALLSGLRATVVAFALDETARFLESRAFPCSTSGAKTVASAAVTTAAAKVSLMR